MNNETLDPQDWSEMRKLGHQMVDDMFDYLENLRNQPVWQQPTSEVKEFLNQPLPQNGENPQLIYQDFLSYILPYNKGNIHPRFFSWVQGNGTPLGMLADMLASGMNPNTTIGDHASMYVELQVIEWAKEMFGFPKEAGGVLVSGATVANLTALTAARNNFNALPIRTQGVDAQMVMYCSAEIHICVIKAAEVLGIGSEKVRLIPTNKAFEISTDILRETIKNDIENGHKPFCVVGNAGSVNTGAIDDLAEIQRICKEFNLWFHIDGAFGSLAKLNPDFAEKLKPIETADSLAFDFHKWMHVPYESGCVLVRDKNLLRKTFSGQPNYLFSHERGLAAGPEPMTNFGIELSRSFKALKVWMSLREHGIQKFGRIIHQNIEQARYLGNIVEQHPLLELLTPVALNIVCFRINDGKSDNETLNSLNKELLMRLQESGVSAPSYTILEDCYAIRVNITNHRTQTEDLHLMIDKLMELYHQISVKVIEFDVNNPSHFEAFKRINYEWITKYFKIEAPDIESLEHPDKYFIEKGGSILLAESENEFVGAVALKPMGNNSMELCKMGVTEKARGKKVGEILGKSIIEKAKQLNTKRLYLETNSGLTPALNLYKKLGFNQVEVPKTPYQRADVAMEMILM